MIRFSFFIFFLLALTASGQTIETKIIFSPIINDSFVIKIRRPPDFSDEKKYHLVYVADGSIKLGNYILGTNSDWMAKVPDNCIVITIGHLGNWHMKRQRDFLPSDAGGYKDNNFGQARNFYTFIRETVIPFVNVKFGKSRSTGFIGHSFSGLFCLYTLFQEDKLFDRHFAISPSVWANHGELMKIEDVFFKKRQMLKATVDLQAGGLELFNKVLSSTKDFYNTTTSRNYPAFSISFSTVNNANHYSMIKPGVDKIFLFYSRLAD